QSVEATSTAQIVFIVPPGNHRPYDRLGERMVETALEALKEVDVILMMVDGAGGPGKGDEEVAAQLAQLSSDLLLVINKMDLVPASKREQAVAAFSRSEERRVGKEWRVRWWGGAHREK